MSLWGLICLTCYSNTSYTIQIVASKTPTDINWFSKKHHIQETILEINEKGWYKYVIGEFENESEALDYISLHLSPSDLQNPFPRTLPDSLQRLLAKATEPSVAASPDTKKETVPSIPTGTVADTSVVSQSAQPLPLLGEKNQTHQTGVKSSKYRPWEKVIGGKNLQKIELLVIGAIQSFLPRSAAPYYIRMVDSVIRYPIILFFLMVILFFILNAILLMVFLELSNTLKNRMERFDELYGTMYERALTGYIFQEYDLEEAVPRIKNIHRARNRKIFVSVLFNFQKNLSGELDQKILDIFSRLGLQADAIKKTQSKSYYNQIVGLSELTNLSPVGAFSIVKEHINDKNNELRAEAQTSYVRLNHSEPFSFLRDLTNPFTQWTQLTSFYIFKLHKLPAPSFVEYLQSDLYNVQNFSLKMIVYFQQKENAPAIIKLLNAPRERTRLLAIRAIQELGIQEAKPLLKEAYRTETYKNRREIIKALLQIGNVEDFIFLENIIRQNDVTLKIEACRSMYFMNSVGMENLLRLGLEKELDIASYVAHIHDPRN